MQMSSFRIHNSEQEDGFLRDSAHAARGHAINNMMEYIATLMSEGKVVLGLEEARVADAKWNPHPTYPGVSLKHLVTGSATNGQLSCHLVKVAAGCQLSTHVHADKLELHEVVSGVGTAMLGEQAIPYAVGTSVVIPANVPHSVVAGQEDVYLLAKFTPALV